MAESAAVLRAAARLDNPPDTVLTGLVVWRGDWPLTEQWSAVEGVIVCVPCRSASDQFPSLSVVVLDPSSAWSVTPATPAPLASRTLPETL